MANTNRGAASEDWARLDKEKNKLVARSNRLKKLVFMVVYLNKIKGSFALYCNNTSHSSILPIVFYSYPVRNASWIILDRQQRFNLLYAPVHPTNPLEARRFLVCLFLSAGPLRGHAVTPAHER